MICPSCKDGIDVAAMTDADAKALRGELMRRQRSRQSPAKRKAAGQRAAKARWGKRAASPPFLPEVSALPIGACGLGGVDCNHGEPASVGAPGAELAVQAVEMAARRSERPAPVPVHSDPNCTGLGKGCTPGGSCKCTCHGWNRGRKA